MSEIFHLIVESPTQIGRLDKILSDYCANVSRSRIRTLIEEGHALLNGVKCLSPSKKLAMGNVVELSVPPPEEAWPEAQNIPLSIIYEDEDLLVINKPAGLVVHPGAGNAAGTLVNALLHHCAESLSGINGVMRPGIVHRLDKETSGLMVVAKSDRAHSGLAAQLEDRTLTRIYKAIVLKVPFPKKGTVDQTISRDTSNRLKMAAGKKSGKAAKTHYKVERGFGEACALIECKLESGRTHQIRVHMAFVGHPLIGDPLYGPQKNAVNSALKKAGYEADEIAKILEFPRQALHAGLMSFIHPVTEEEMTFESPLPQDMANLLKILDKAD